MNIHVIFVHFPVALLTVYSLIELVRIKRLLALPYFFYLKAFLVITGELGALLALFTGGTAEAGFAGRPDVLRVIDTHSTFGGATAALFGLIALFYFAAWLNRAGALLKHPKLSRLASAADRALSSFIIVPVALVGLALITITGALGGAIAFGPNVDPVSSLVYSWFKF